VTDQAHIALSGGITRLVTATSSVRESVEFWTASIESSLPAI
jgi:hypothetical protein